MVWRALTSILALARHTFISDYAITPPALSITGKTSLLNMTCPMWRLLVALQSFPSSAGRFYSVSLFSFLLYDQDPGFEPGNFCLQNKCRAAEPNQNVAFRLKPPVCRHWASLSVQYVGIEPTLSPVGSQAHHRSCVYCMCTHGRDQTYDLLNVNQTLLSLSYASYCPATR